MKDFSKLAKVAVAVILGGLVLTLPTTSCAAPKTKTEGKAPAAAPAQAARRIEIQVTEDGFEPSPIQVKKGEPLTLAITRKTEKTCATELVLDEGNINVPLPFGKTVEVPFTPAKTGEIKYGCAMGKMVAGVLMVE